MQLGVLTAPVRRGREALFGARQIAEFFVARMLQSDGWPLAKIAELMGTYEFPLPVPVGDEKELPTPAERALARISVEEGPKARYAAAEFATGPAASKRPPMPDPLDRATALAASRMDLADTLRSLGNAAGRPEREDLVRIRLTPWANVDVDIAQLRRLGPEAEEALGRALTEALRQHRITKGDYR